MVEGVVVGGSDSAAGSKPTSFESAGDRLRFRVEVRPGETTIVSWKKLLKESNSNKPNASSVSRPSSEAHQQPVPPPVPLPLPLPPPPLPATSKQPKENEPKDAQAQAGPNLLSNVIERIERMYAGNGSSEEEDVFLDDVPDDDEYDTDDSFIDDAELNDYFQVDKSTIKHDGFFINRGKLERIEPTISKNEQPKKRRRKDVTKGQSGKDEGQISNKQVKIGSKTSSSAERKSTSPQHRVTGPNIPSPTNAVEASLKRKTADTQITMDPSALLNVDSMKQDKDADKQRSGTLSSHNHNNKRKENSELHDTSDQKSNNKSSHVSKTHSGKQQNNDDELHQTIQRKEKGGLVERFDLNVPASRDSTQTTKVPPMPRKEGSNSRPKITVLEKAIRELEKIVAESRPSSTEVQDHDNSSQAVKRRLPQDIKQKLAKVARLAHNSYGKMPKDVINRLMSILGHLMQLRTLKRNLRVMANLGLSAKREKDDRLQKIKLEVAEMVKLQIPYIKPRVEQPVANSDGLPEDGKEALKQKYRMDDALENKICDLYDLYLERLEEDSGPPVRRLYEELAAMWPSGVMDTDGIKRAIYKAKDRRRALSGQRKNQEKIKRKKVLAPKAEDTTLGEAINININPALDIHEKSSTASHDHAVTSPSAVARAPLPLANVPTDDVLPKEKVKRKPNAESVEAQTEESHKHLKHAAAVSLSKQNLQPSGSENPS